MKIFRSHILRSYSFFVLLIGITLHLAGDSEQQAHHAAFTSWLGSHLKNSDSEAHQALENLSKDHSELDEVIHHLAQASACAFKEMNVLTGIETSPCCRSLPTHPPSKGEYFCDMCSHWNNVHLHHSNG